jgi:hypothetical protein
MKNIIMAIIVVISLLFIGCDDQNISIDDYGSNYESLMFGLGEQVQEGLFTEASDMLNTRNFLVVYSHEDFVHFYDEFITKLDETLYEYSQIGPRLDDVVIMKHQSKIENNLFNIMTTLKQYRELQNFNTNVVNSFSFYENIYTLMRDLSDDYIELNKQQLELEAYLKDKGYKFNESYVKKRYETIQAYAYMYFTLSTKLASYQDYSGLQVNPRFPVLVTNNDGDIYLTSELDFNVMLTTVDHVGALLRDLSDIDLATKVSFEDDKWINDFLTNAIRAYEAYADIRSQYSYDFFKGGDFKEYQVSVKGETTILGRDPGFKVYGFDESTDEGAELLEMENLFYYLVFLMDSTHHAEMMHVN